MSVNGAPAGLLQDFQALGDKKNGHIGVVLVHGFHGTPAAMRPWAEFLNARGYSVRVPLLPGHGTKPSDLNEVQWPEWPAKVKAEIVELQKHCSQVFVAGLSMGGGTTLHVAAELGDKLSGIILVNPMIHVRGITPTLAFAISRVVKFGRSVGNDIKRKGVTEYSYDKMPYRGIHQLLTMLQLTRAALPSVRFRCWRWRHIWWRWLWSPRGWAGWAAIWPGWFRRGSWPWPVRWPSSCCHRPACAGGCG